MIKACEYSALVNEEQAKRLWINYNRRGWRNGEPLDDRVPAEGPVLLRRCFDMLVRDGGQPKAQILLQLRLNPNLVEELAALPNGYFHDAMDIGTAAPKMKNQEELQNSASNVITFASVRGR